MNSWRWLFVSVAVGRWYFPTGKRRSASMVTPPVGKIAAPSAISCTKMYHTGAIGRIGCRESPVRFDGQFGLLRLYEWSCVCNRVRSCMRNCARNHERKLLGNAERAGTALRAILKFFVPGHLDRF